MSTLKLLSVQRFIVCITVFMVVSSSIEAAKASKGKLKKCKLDEFRCDNGDCIKTADLCGDKLGCPDKSDEEHCAEQLCKLPKWFRCKDPSNECISTAFVCDGTEDCLWGEDEMNCDNYTIHHDPTPCTEEQFTCSDKLCIALDLACDGISHCDDGTDETIGCEILTKCEGFRCKNKKCLHHMAWFCDGQNDCGDNSDEEHCTPHCTIEYGKFQCSDNETCISIDSVCNKIKDCPNGEDEGASCEAGTCATMKCPGQCKATPTGATCICAPGFTYNTDNKTCVDIDECEGYGICSQICINSPGSYKCDCETKFYLQPDNRTCQVQGEPLMIYSSQDAVMGKYLHANTQYVIAKNLSQVIGVSFDGTNVYWTDITHHTGGIVRAREDGSHREILMTAGIESSEDLQVDWLTGNIYFSDSNQTFIAACTNDGIHCKVLIQLEHGQSPRGIALHPQRGEMYWTDWGDKSMIGKSSMDGSDVEVFVDKDIKWPNGLALDWPNNRLYWVDAKQHKLESIRLDGRDRRIVLKDFIRHPFGISVFQDKIYWSDWDTLDIKSCDKFTGKHLNVEVVNRQIYDIDIYHSALLPQSNHSCMDNSCSHICFLAKNNTYSCACPADMLLDVDEHTCKETGKRQKIYIGIGNSLMIMEDKPIGRHGKLAAYHVDEHVDKLVFNSLNGELFVADNNLGAIFTLNLESTITTKLISDHIGFISDLAFDHLSNNLYWTDSERFTVEIYSLATGHRAIVQHFMGASTPIALAIIPKLGTMFIALRDHDYTHIDKQTMNGKGLHTHIIEDELTHNEGFHFAVDYELEMVFWSDTSANQIESTDFEGLSRHTFQHDLFYPSSMAVIGSNLFWTSTKDRSLFWAAKTNDRPISQMQIDRPSFITRYPEEIPITASAPLKISHHMCAEDNGGCSHICVSMGSTTRDCLCPTGMIYKDSTNETCIEHSDCEYKCSSGECLDEAKRCDGHIDCADHSDEEDCEADSKKTPVKCSYNEFPCADKTQCIDQNLRCDMNYDCNDKSDESNCSQSKEDKINCSLFEHACDNGRCVSLVSLCDGKKDCVDGSDEDNCQRMIFRNKEVTQCPKKMFTCLSGDCIAKEWVCDGDFDCKDGSDEHDKCPKAVCPPNTFKCKSGMCIDNRLLCDGHGDCNDDSDESEETCVVITDPHCADNQFPCTYNKSICLDSEKQCNGVADCPRGEDERGCEGCNMHEFQCDNKKCIRKEFVCDNENDCGDKSDELHCNGNKSIVVHSRFFCPTGTFRCLDGSACIETPYLCNGNADCADGSDENAMCKVACKKSPCDQKCIATPTGPVCGCNTGYFLSGNKKTCLDVDECSTISPCAQKCENTVGSYKCSCYSGFLLRMDQISCKVHRPNNYLLFTTYDQIRSIVWKPPTISVLWSGENSKIMTLDANVRKKHLYFILENSDSLFRFDVNSRSLTYADLGSPWKVAVDWITDNVYFINHHDYNPSISVCHMENKVCSNIIRREYRDVMKTITVDAINRFIFFTTTQSFIYNSPTSCIHRANMDGTQITDLFTDVGHITAVTFDANKKMLYFSDLDSKSIRMMDYEGHNVKFIIKQNAAASRPIALSIFEDKIWILNSGSSVAGICKLYGDRECKLFHMHIFDAENLLVMHESRQPSIANVCENHNCTHLCVQADAGPKCICHAGKHVQPHEVCDDSEHSMAVKFGEHNPSPTSEEDPTLAGVVLISVFAVIIVCGGIIMGGVYLYRRHNKFGNFNISMHFEKSRVTAEENVKMCYSTPQVISNPEYNELTLGDTTGGASIINIQPPIYTRFCSPGSGDSSKRNIFDETAAIGETSSDGEFNQTENLNERLIR